MTLKQNHLQVLIPLFAFTILSLSFAGCGEKPVKATVGNDGVQSVKVLVKHGYEPRVIQAQADKPLRIEFYRDEDPGQGSCGQELEIPAENVKLTLPARETQIVELKPHPKGELAFRCGMKMMQGEIQFK